MKGTIRVDGDRGARVLRVLVVLTTVACLLLAGWVLELAGRIRDAEAASASVDGRLLRIYERVRRVQKIIEDRERAAGREVPPDPSEHESNAGAPPAGR